MSQSARLYSVDLFRGITIAGMLIVNNPGSWSNVYPPLLHAEWAGCTPTDLVFPFFLFIVGVVLPIALDRRIEGGTTRKKLFRKIGSRTLLIIGFGLFLTAFPDFGLKASYRHLAGVHYALLSLALAGLLAKEIGESFVNRSDWGERLSRVSRYVAWAAILGMIILGVFAYDLSALRYPGVLQRIGLVYGICATFYLFSDWRGQLAATVILLVGYWLWMSYVPMPDGSTPLLEPGNNWAAWVDSRVLAGHMWSQTETWDPEGLMSTLPAIATCLLGILLGKLLQSGYAMERQLSLVFIGGIAGIALGMLWSIDFPMIKALWTSSYVLYTAGIGALFFALLYWLVDMKGWRQWANPLVAFGANALFAYILSTMLAKVMGMTGWPGSDGNWQSTTAHFYYFYAHLLAPKAASLAVALTHLLIVYLPVELLYRYRVFIKV